MKPNYALIIVVAYITFFIGAVVADSDHELVLHQWWTVLVVLGTPAILGWLVGLRWSE